MASRKLRVASSTLISALRQRIRLVAALCGLMLLVYCVNSQLQGELFRFGIVPRSVSSFPHILTAPFIHLDSAHLINNLLGLSLFSAICLLRSIRFYIGASLFIILCSGLLVWLLGRPAVHLGASGWIFGLWSLSIAMAYFQHDFRNLMIAVVVLFFYGGMIVGVLPKDASVSFESHLFGVVAGILYSKLSAGASAR